MALLICYDISPNRLRTRIAKVLLSRGLTRVQKSVFLYSGHKRELTYTLKRLKEWIETYGDPGDKLYLIVVSPEMLRRMVMIGEQMDMRILLGDDLIFL